MNLSLSAAKCQIDADVKTRLSSISSSLKNSCCSSVESLNRYFPVGNSDTKKPLPNPILPVPPRAKWKFRVALGVGGPDQGEHHLDRRPSINRTMVSIVTASVISLVVVAPSVMISIRSTSASTGYVKPCRQHDEVNWHAIKVITRSIIFVPFN